MANRKGVFISNVGRRTDNWHTNNVGPWRLAYSYTKEDGTKINVETRWKGISYKYKKYWTAWRSSSETREIVVRGPTEQPT